MIQLFTIRFVLFIVVALSWFNGIAQKKLLILGSSTSACFGPDSYDNCYVGRLQKHYQNQGTPISIDNRAVGGYNCYIGMPAGYNPPPGRNAPHPYNNISSGLEGNPDVVLINYPSNGYDVFSVDEVLFCLRTIKQTANNAGKPCYITTSQPRSDPESFRTPAVRQRMAEIKERVMNEFGAFAVNFWDGIVNPADNSILSMYDTDGVHLNSAGHAILFNRVLERNIFNQPSPDNSPPTTPGNLRTVSSNTTSIGLVWDNSTDNTAVAGYEVYINNNKQYTTSSSNITANNLTPNTTYAFTVRAYDQAGNFSAFSNTVSASTSGGAPSSGGLSYRYYEGDWNTLPDFNALSPIKSGVSANIGLGNRNRNNHFGFVWEGFINIPAAGNYNFELLSDDGSKFYFNTNYSPAANALVNNDGLHAGQSAYGTVYVPGAGRYPVAITYFEKDGDETMQLFWSGPGIARQPVPDAAFTNDAPSPAGALQYRYYEGDWNSLPDFNALNPVKSGTTPNINLNNRNRNDHYGFVWEGYIHVPAAGNYTFELLSDDGSKMYFNSFYSFSENALVNNDGLHPGRSAYGSVYIPAAGSYPVAFTFFEKDQGELMQVYWSGPGFSRERIPASAFSGSASFTGNEELYIDDQAYVYEEGNVEPENITAKISGNTIQSDLDSRLIGPALKAYPNPFTDRFTIQVNTISSVSDISIELTDYTGRLIHKQQFKKVPAGRNVLNISTGNQQLTKGIYFVQMKVNGKAGKILKMVKN